jgi:hypothetical protein
VSIFTNTYTTFDAKGIREDLSDAIYNISPTDTPFVSNIKKEKASNTFFEWQTDSLAAASSSNQQLDGDDITSVTAATPTVRVGNYTNISRKTVAVSGTLEAVDKAGRKGELAYQLAKRSAEIKRDMEKAALENIGAQAGGTADARVSAGMGAWLKTNTAKGSGGTDPVYTNIPDAARGDGTTAAFTEAMLKSAMKSAYDNGGKPEMLMVGSANKQTASGFSGVATKTFYQSAVEETAIIGAADVYVSDFGTLAIVPNRFQRSRDAWLIDPEYAAIAYLRPFMTVPLAKTGDAEKRMLLVEWGLKVHNEAAHAGIFDLT